jgi:ABC-type transport system involved in multi-copper enzyme maturation permease subunit
MFTGSLALLHRALRLDARLLRTHLFRFAFAVLIYFSLLGAQSLSLTVGAPGLKLFEQISFLNLGLITLAGVSFFATAISEEKEEETLGILKMAGLNPIGILLGKSTSRLMGTILLLLVQFPFTLLAITLGGVTLGQVLAGYASLAAYLILLANVGLLSSVVMRRGGNASAMTVLFLVCYFFAGFVVGSIRLGLVHGGLIGNSGRIASALVSLETAGEAASVLTRLVAIMKTGFSGGALGFQVWSNLAIAAGCFLTAWAGFDHFTRDWRSTVADMPRPFWRRKRSGRPHQRPQHNSIAWKEFQFITGGWRVLWIKFAGYGLLTLVIFYTAARYYNDTFDHAAIVVITVMGALVVIEASLYVSRIFHDEWRERTLPLLMMLPIPPSRIVAAKVAGCLPALAPALFWLLAGCILLPEGPRELLNAVILPSRWFWLLIILLFLTLTAFFSVVVKWGALPLALAVMLTGAVFGGCCFSPVMVIVGAAQGAAGGLEGAFLCVDTVLALLIAGLQFDIHRRLEIVASQ